MQPIKGSRYLTGEPPVGMGLMFYGESATSIVASVILDARHEGPPGHVHGGFSASLIDEAMGGAVWRAGFQGVAANLNVNFRLPVPLGVEVVVRGWVERVEGRKIFTAGSVTLPDGQTAVEGRGLFIEATHLFRDSRETETIFRDLGDIESET